MHGSELSTRPRSPEREPSHLLRPKLTATTVLVGFTSIVVATWDWAGCNGRARGGHFPRLGGDAGGERAPWPRNGLTRGGPWNIAARKSRVAGLEKGSWNAYLYCPVDDSENMKLTEELGDLVCPI